MNNLVNKNTEVFNVENVLKLKITEKENKFNIDVNSMFSIAYRQNKKRAFLFVSKLIGKHIPIKPQVPLITSYLLAQIFVNKVDNYPFINIHALIDSIENEANLKQSFEFINNNKLELTKNTLFIGFAETATALAHGIFSSFIGNHAFVHSTRENIDSLELVMNFDEEHSHAVEHKFYSLDKDIFKRYDRIVLIDDELTTGKTALNLVNEIKNQFGDKEFYVISILDWRKDLLLEDNNIEVLSLFKGYIEFDILGAGNIQDSHYDIDTNFSTANLTNIELKHDYLIKFQDSLYTRMSGRFGLDTNLNNYSFDNCRKYGEYLSKFRKHTNTLVIGYGEYMYIPALIASSMGENVDYESLTQSPIFSINKDYYPVRDKFSFTDPYRDVERYVYNIEFNKYKEVFIFTESELPNSVKSVILTEISKRGVKDLSFVTFKEHKNPEPMGSYKDDDVTFLLKELNDHIKEQDNETREVIIQNGGHYSEMLPIEYEPKKEYVDLFYKILETTKFKIAAAVSVVSELLIENYGFDIVLVSLARAGTPIGVAIKRYIKYKYNIEIPHYSISIIRGKGIDENAVKYILENHPTRQMKFIDGWTGKGAIKNVLNAACNEYFLKYGISLDSSLSVLADPAYCSQICGTREDFLIPSACLNSTVSGLMSRTVLKSELIGIDDYHGAKFYKQWVDIDLSNYYIDTICNEFSNLDNLNGSSNCFGNYNIISKEALVKENNLSNKEILEIQNKFSIKDINLIKPGVGETTRVLLRRVPWKILVKDLNDGNLKHIFLLCKDRNVAIEEYKNMHYSCCGIIKSKGES